LEKLEFEEIAADAPTAAIRCPAVGPRNGAAVRCRDLAIGYPATAAGPARTIAADIDVEIVHGSRAAIVGDNGQGKTTFLRTLVRSLDPLGGDVKWGHGCEIGIYAQHVYTSLPEQQAVLGYLEQAARIGTKQQQILDLAGAMLFRGKAVEKRIGVLSGGERARLCLAGLLLGSFNVLVLDEPGNHLDVETVDALAAALLDYQGTVIFTSHDRSFVETVATTVVEVKEGRVINYLGSYAQYLAAVTKEIDDHDEFARERRPAAGKAVKPAAAKAAGRDDRDVRKEIATLERTISRLDADKRRCQEALLAATDPDDAVRRHAELTAVADKLAAAEERWLALQDTLAG
jgi:ATP-binding cassette subfamily F protein 3